jgi:hypothetical protein
VGLGYSRLKSSEETSRRRGERGGGPLGGRGEPVGALDGAGVAGVGLLDCEQELRRDAGVGRRRSGKGGWRGKAGRNQQVEGDPIIASVWAEEEQKVELDGEVEWRC